MHSSVMKLAAKYGLVTSACRFPASSKASNINSGLTAASRALVQARGLYANNKPVLEKDHKLTKADLIDGRVAILRAGKNKLVVLVSHVT